METTERRMICIFCGGRANIRKQKDLKIVSCPSCNRETELDTYQQMFDQWVDEIRKEE